MSAKLKLLAKNIPILLFLIYLSFTLPAGYALADSQDKPKPEQPKSDEKSTPEKENPQAPWGRSYSAGAKVTVQLDTEMEPEIRIENDQEGVSVCRLTSRKGDTESKPRRIVLKTESSAEEPFLGIKGFQSVTLEVDTGKVFFIVEQKGDMFSKQGYAEDRYLKTSKKYSTAGKGFLVAADHNLLIKLAADSKETNGAEGYFKLFKGSYTDTIDSIPFSLQNGESEIWEYPANKGIASWEITLTGGGIRISYRQPEKL
jgi:hypothetical protein